MSASLPASAWPVDGSVDMELGHEKFLRFSAIEWAEVDSPQIASVEVFPQSSELLLTPASSGRALLLMYAEGKMAVWRIRVGGKEALSPALSSSAQAAAEKACPGMKEEGGKLVAPVRSEGCRAALLELFKTDAYRARDVELGFDAPVLQAQLAALSRALPKGVTAQYLGAGLVLKGKVSAAARRKTYWQVFLNTVGRPALDDELEGEGQNASP
jgi:hypothetical protein